MFIKIPKYNYINIKHHSFINKDTVLSYDGYKSYSAHSSTKSIPCKYDRTNIYIYLSKELPCNVIHSRQISKHSGIIISKHLGNEFYGNPTSKGTLDIGGVYGIPNHVLAVPVS